MQLVDRGPGRAGRPVRAYLPVFRTADEGASARITVRHLLTHTGGFEGDIWAATTAGEDALQRFVEDSVAARRSVLGRARCTRIATPGTACSAGWWRCCAARRTPERCGGTWPARWASRRSPSARTRRWPSAPRSVTSGRGPDAALRPSQVWAVLPPSNPAAGNQLAMSARALIAFARMHLADGLAPGGTRLLSGPSAPAMRERQVDHPAAIGWTCRAWARLDAGEAAGGGRARGRRAGAGAALLRTVPEQGVAVAMLTNGGEPGPLVNDAGGPVAARPRRCRARARAAAPAADVRVAGPRRYWVATETRATRSTGHGRRGRSIRAAVSDRNEALTMDELAGRARRTRTATSCAGTTGTSSCWSTRREPRRGLRSSSARTPPGERDSSTPAGPLPGPADRIPSSLSISTP